MSCISTHSLTRRLTRNQSIVSRLRCISTHSLTRRLTHDFPTADLFFSFQLTASQGGWQRCGILPHPHGRISTHSLTRRLTEASIYNLLQCCISTHSLTRRLTSKNGFKERADIISTHSLTRRLTTVYTYNYNRILFQLTASQGGWQDHKNTQHHQGDFNSQPHKEADNVLKWIEQTFQHFNSQPHKEADGTLTVNSAAGSISTHSLTRRLTEYRHLPWVFKRISTHSLTRRLTSTDSTVLASLKFQLTASQGGWPYSAKFKGLRKTFQLTASQGGWLWNKRTIS